MKRGRYSLESVLDTSERLVLSFCFFFFFFSRLIIIGSLGSDEQKLRKVLTAVFGYHEFRSREQREACLAVMGGQSQTAVLLPTGAGKSLCYQLPALCLPGVSIVISPLIALMKDQVLALKDRIARSSLSHLLSVDMYDSKMSTDERSSFKDAMWAAASVKSAGRSHLVYLTPEFLAMEANQRMVGKIADSLAVVAFDEAHSVLEMGENFRPAYLELGWLSELPGVRTVALTASVSRTRLNGVLESLRMTSKSLRKISSSFNRSNIQYTVCYPDFNRGHQNVEEVKLKHMLDWINTRDFPEGDTARTASGIVYVRSIKDCERVAQQLCVAGIEARAYYASASGKDDIQRDWMENRLQVIVATVSFGMGIDKADVRYVVNWNISKSMASFYQESGRAGRDGKKSFSLAYMGLEDAKILHYLSGKPTETEEAGTAELRERRAGERLQEVMDLLEWMRGKQCRRTGILAYFEQEKLADNCQNCDWCLDSASVKRALRGSGWSELDLSGLATMNTRRSNFGGGGGLGSSITTQSAGFDTSLYPEREPDDPTFVVATTSNTGDWRRPDVELLQETVEERITKRAREVAKIPISKEQRQKNVVLLEKAIVDNLNSFESDTRWSGKFAVKEEHAIFLASKDSVAAYKAGILKRRRAILSLSKANPPEMYVFE